MTRVVGDVGQPRRMETCGAEEPYEGNLHVRFCGGSGRVIADPTRTPDASTRRTVGARVCRPRIATAPAVSLTARAQEIRRRRALCRSLCVESVYWAYSVSLAWWSLWPGR